MSKDLPSRIIVMGVTGCGKSTIGAMLAEVTGATFLDGDDCHPPANVAKMAAGRALTDADRWPWLDRLGAAIEDCVSEHGPAVTACSALRRIYRQRLTASCREPPLFVHLDGGPQTIRRRMSARAGHYMPVSLLDSQLATLEPLSPEEHAVAIDIGAEPEALVAEILRRLERSSTPVAS
ncbi:MAG: gluconokinase [Pseudomonadota bacterium]